MKKRYFYNCTYTIKKNYQVYGTQETHLFKKKS